MENTYNILHNTKDGVVFNVKLVPNSSCNKIKDYTNDYAGIKISAPPLENRANKELIEFCSKLFDVNKSKISIISGGKSKFKKVLIKDADLQDISKKLLFVLNSIQKS